MALSALGIKIASLLHLGILLDRVVRQRAVLVRLVRFAGNQQGEERDRDKECGLVIHGSVENAAVLFAVGALATALRHGFAADIFGRAFVHAPEMVVQDARSSRFRDSAIAGAAIAGTTIVSTTITNTSVVEPSIR
ncbi:MAG TPA: hypothetical protein VFG83_09750 [Kofleriaceae bacterium]|nr:hypothetical protein [Kofleriaceae bacterium]